MQHKPQPSLLVSASLLQPILYGSGVAKTIFHDTSRPGPKGYCINLMLDI